MGAGSGDDREPRPEALSDVLAYIRALVSAETAARTEPQPSAESVLMLTEAMRVATAEAPPARSGEVLSEGIEPRPPRAGAPILDEEALRGVVNTIVREELQGELGDRISRNLRKLIRREIGQVMEEARQLPPGEGREP